MTDAAPTPGAPQPGAFDMRLLEPARGKRILVCLTGGIAAYKTCTIVSRLAQAGANVHVAMTESATRFVTPLTFQALSANPVYTSAWDHIESKDPQHVSLARDADLVLVAPCTMDCMARLAHGLTDDVVTLIISAVDRAKTPVLLAPAMNAAMWGQPSTQRNLATLLADGFKTIGPGTGWQACRTVGEGRMTEPEEILRVVAQTLRA
ncbi:MAG TPA: flavoprotein [Phycisphaerales bacterium]|nr:flavoprotein [Phycisphaerales bacterium]